MLFRIDMKHFLLHAINYFTASEILSLNYVIISAKVINGGRLQNIGKISQLYPSPELIFSYEQTNDYEAFEKNYFNLLDPDDYESKILERGGSYHTYNVLYTTFIVPMKKFHNIVILCDESENYIVDALTKYMYKRFGIECVDLNKLFSKENDVGVINFNIEKIMNKTKKLQDSYGNESVMSLRSSEDGRLKLIKMMKKKDKISKLEEYGITLNKDDMKKLDELLLEAWNADESLE